MKLETKFNIGQSVQLITDEEKKRRVVILPFTIFSEKHIHYTLACGTETSSHLESEIELWQEPPLPQSQKHITGFGKSKEIEKF